RPHRPSGRRRRCHQGDGPHPLPPAARHGGLSRSWSADDTGGHRRRPRRDRGDSGVSARIQAIATHLPERVVSNAELEAENPSWKMTAVADRAGVLQRHIAASGETAFDLAAIAAEKLITKLPAKDAAIDAIIFCTQTPDFVMPGNAHL